MESRDRRTRDDVLMDYQKLLSGHANEFFGDNRRYGTGEETGTPESARGPVHIKSEKEKTESEEKEIREAEKRRQKEERNASREQENKKDPAADKEEELLRKKAEEEEKREAEEYERWKAERKRSEEEKRLEDERRERAENARYYEEYIREKKNTQAGTANSFSKKNVSETLRRSPLEMEIAEEREILSGAQNSAGRIGSPFDTVPGFERDGETPAETPVYRAYDGEIEKPEPVPGMYRMKVVSIYSPKGGVGKTSFSESVSCAFSHRDARLSGRELKVLLVDFDWEFPDCHTSFNVEAYPNFYKLVDVMKKDLTVNGKLRPYYDRRLLEQCIIHVNERLDILCGSEDPAEHRKLSPDIVRALMAAIRTLDYDVVVVDNANSVKSITFTVLECSDIVLLLSSLDFTTIDEINRFLSTARERQFDLRKLKLVINAVPDKLGDNIPTPQEVVDVYNIDHIADIPEDPSVREYTNAGEPYMWSGKNTAYVRAVRAMVNKILPVFPEKKRGLFAGLFKR